MATRSIVSKFTPDDVCELLSEKIPMVKTDTLFKFKMEKKNGSAFLGLNTEDLKELVPTLSERKAIQKLIRV